MPILTEGTAEVASGKPGGKNIRTGAKMVQWFFLDGVHGKGGNMTVKRQNADSVFITPHATGAKMTVGYCATSRAERTTDNAAGFFV
jgi:hypothetical protein